MKPAPFEYHRVETADEAVARLAELGEDAKILAGGQSLVPMMNFRLARPEALLDVSRLEELRGVRREGEVLRVGALTRHADIEAGAGGALGDGYEPLARIARLVGHLPIRTRGTFGGSLAHADPAAEWCVVASALGAEVVVRSGAGARTVAADAFFQGFFTTALAPDELLVEVAFPRRWHRFGLQEFARRHGDFAMVAVCVALDLDGDVVSDLRVVVGGVDDVPVRARSVEALLRGERPTAARLDEAAAAAAGDVHPVDDIHGGADYRRRLTSVLARRALAEVVV